MATNDLCEICEIETGDSSEMSVVARGLPAMIATSEKRGDGYWQYWKNVNNITVHTRCYETYMGTMDSVKTGKRKSQESVHKVEPHTKKQRVSVEVPVESKSNCIFCGQICDEALESKKISSKRRAVVTELENSCLKEDIEQSIQLINDDWALVVQERIRNKDSLIGVKYHGQCRNKFLFHRKKLDKQSEEVQCDGTKYIEAMKKIYEHIENSGEYQFALEDLKKMIAFDISLDYIKKELEKKCENDIIVTSLNPRRTIVTLKRYEDQILSEYYETENPKSDTNRQTIINAAEIINDDIQTTLFDSSTYPVIASVLDRVSEIIPESLKSFLDGIILKQRKKVSHKLYSKKIQGIAYSMMANTL